MTILLIPPEVRLVGMDGEIAARAIASEVGFAKTFLQGFHLSNDTRKLRALSLPVGCDWASRTDFPTRWE